MWPRFCSNIYKFLFGILEENRAALSEHFIPFRDGVQKSDFVT